MPITHTYKIVGAFYRPPAQAILNHLPFGAPLVLLPEPENEHDPNAIAVWIKSEDIPASEDLEGALLSHGLDHAALRAEPYWHLGYIPRDIAGVLKGLGLSDRHPAQFSISPDAKPLVKFDL